jgi:hypothetical protein
MLIFVEGGNPEDPEKNPRGKGEKKKTQLTCITRAEDRTYGI